MNSFVHSLKIFPECLLHARCCSRAGNTAINKEEKHCCCGACVRWQMILKHVLFQGNVSTVKEKTTVGWRLRKEWKLERQKPELGTESSTGTGHGDPRGGRSRLGQRCKGRLSGRAQRIWTISTGAKQRSEWRWCWSQRGDPDAGKTLDFTLSGMDSPWVWANEAHIIHSLHAYMKPASGAGKIPVGSRWRTLGQEQRQKRRDQLRSSCPELSSLCCTEVPPASGSTHGSACVSAKLPFASWSTQQCTCVRAKLQFAPHPALWWPRGVAWVWCEGGDVLYLQLINVVVRQKIIQRGKAIMLLLKILKSYCTRKLGL